ncbi:MAG: hypothetical protein LQ345_000842 [Seirophora villosa]|nr:MAG: hypothetical protein LQ345_000842 [Seirophora villosa]
MLFRKSNQSLFFLSTLILSTSQVDVTINFAPRDFLFHSAEFTCSDIRPGYCCTLPWMQSLRVRSISDLVLTVRFDHLLAWDIAAVWGVYFPAEHTRDNDGCQGTVGASRAGPGTWEWDVLDQDEGRHFAAKGASYISLPRVVPPDTSSKIWLAAEGIVGLAWGDATWFKNSQAQTALIDGAAAISSRVTPRSRLKRDIRSPLEGTVWATQPSRPVYPNLLVVNGTAYTDDGAGDPKYRDVTGKVLDLTEWFDSL